ncbi:gas vesicle protein [Streptomyces viridochromogenes]|uniref:Gas vesicle protein n=1 Tax=Streptomyces viridochromogenes TaxID=1938 RepID=A0A0J8BT44_STRVR|nr:GvpL/GvpF family gas vesicle protein [Streptomyces viridochromogenes]KMS68775.1 gas vesicle protein [Streptomyces viridochromogenes]KOG17143.1 gas vesicle protein [Streptomyces viridochromogenes]KOG20163.1 gas vesicle protein [Streptomyces viridochromogenes]
MSVYVYAITKESHPLDLGDVKGVGDPPGEVRVVRGASLCAVVSECPEDLSVARRDIQAHQDVQERLWADGPTLPLSFGFVAADEEAVRGVLEERAQLFAQRLDELAGRAEFNVKGVLDEDTLVRAVLEQNTQARELNELTRSGGGTYEDRLALGELVSQEVQGRQDALAGEVLAALRPLAEAEKVAPPSHQYFVSASFLLDEDRAEEFNRVGQELAERYGEGVELRLRGPLPPYSFV